MIDNWTELKNFYRRAWQHGQLEQTVFLQAKRRYGDLNQLRRLGVLHQAGNYFLLTLTSARHPAYQLTYFLHQFQPTLSYLQLADSEHNLVFRLPEIAPPPQPLSKKTSPGLREKF